MKVPEFDGIIISAIISGHAIDPDLTYALFSTHNLGNIEPEQYF